MSAVEVARLRRVVGGVRAVDESSWSARSGEVTAVLGPNGAGKTTTMECLEGLQRPTSGTARVLGTDPWRAPAEHRARVGVMLQDGGLPVTTTARRLLHHVARLHTAPADVAALMRRLELDRVADRSVRRLSGGERQRVALAAALVGRPEVAFLDEPTAGLDPHARLEVWDLVRETAPRRSRRRHHPLVRGGRAHRRPRRHHERRPCRRRGLARRGVRRAPARGALLRPHRREPAMSTPTAAAHARTGAGAPRASGGSPRPASRRRRSSATASSCSSPSCSPSWPCVGAGPHRRARPRPGPAHRRRDGRGARPRRGLDRLHRSGHRHRLRPPPGRAAVPRGQPAGSRGPDRGQARRRGARHRSSSSSCWAVSPPSSAGDPSAVGGAAGARHRGLGAAAFLALAMLLAGTVRAEGVLALANLVWVLLLGLGVLLPTDRLPDALAGGRPAAALRRAGRRAAPRPRRGRVAARRSGSSSLVWALAAGARRRPLVPLVRLSTPRPARRQYRRGPGRETSAQA